MEDVNMDVNAVAEPDGTEAETPERHMIDDADAKLLFETRQRVTRLKEEHNIAKDAAAEAKKAYDAAVTELVGFLSRVEREFEDGPGPLFDGDEAPGSIIPDAWRTVALCETDLPDKTVDLLREAGIVTLGDVSDHHEAHPNRGLQTIDGIGPETAEAVSDATAKWWDELATERTPEDAATIA